MEERSRPQIVMPSFLTESHFLPNSIAAEQLAAERLAQEQSPARPAVTWRELLAVLLLVVLGDLTLYWGHGFGGYALLLAAAPLAVLLGATRHQRLWQVLAATLMIWGAALRLAWCGNWLAFALGGVLLIGLSTSLAGKGMYFGDVLRWLASFIPSLFRGLADYEAAFRRRVSLRWGLPTQAILWAYLLPPICAVIFLGLFIQANPDISLWVQQRLLSFRELWSQVWSIIGSPYRMGFWLICGCVAIVLMRPHLWTLYEVFQFEPLVDLKTDSTSRTDLYPAYRNTILVLIVLFAMYLVFEFVTMWTRTFPPGFHYSGYAHEGAAWLTVALALATIMLSIIFNASMMTDPRMPALRNLAMIWAAENILLALAVYNRLFIYVGFNGMTRMRVVGILGVTSVLAGVVLMMIKISRGHSFGWLLKNQIFVVAVAAYLYAVLPVDGWVMTYNVRQVLAGNLPPSVQIAHHPTTTEGWLTLLPLQQAENQVIREGVVEMLTNHERRLKNVPPIDWTARQLADEQFLRAVALPENDSLRKRIKPGAEDRFRSFSFQWY
ncbi:hypothetical protein Spb1_37680 [Planctopirus ephydatiae]|uniref:Uncharacterized protein n=1 Tax=Planctopirus ephydatiae TaxID=2528019 RepID=A0A518GTB2_9PLAN|nr:DUF4153 domain-containing protein [Planctopirus ephydatiae]QDV31823.1 hypothetical protein Spb1_37680 [Planctopirus ephydatiae]